MIYSPFLLKMTERERLNKTRGKVLLRTQRVLSNRRRLNTWLLREALVFIFLKTDRRIT